MVHKRNQACSDGKGLPHPQTRVGQPFLGEWNDDDFDVLASGEVVGKANATPVGSPWMWTLVFGHHKDRSPTHGYSATREDAMGAFAKRENFAQAMLVAAAAVRLRGVAVMKLKLSAALVAALLSPFAGTARADTTVLFDNTFSDTTAAPIFTQSTGGSISATVCANCGNTGPAIQGMF